MKVFLDMDGVLADHDNYVTDRLFSDPDLTYGKLLLEEDFFNKLKKTDIADVLIEVVTQLYGGYSIISTPNPIAYIEGAMQKTKWISANLAIKPNAIIFTDDKSIYAKNNLLIDDYRPNVQKWREAGGIAIKYKHDSEHYNFNDLVRLLGSIHIGQNLEVYYE